MLFFLVWFGQTGFGLGWPKEDHAKEVCWHHKAWQCLSTENKSEVGWSLTVRNSWNRDFYCKLISSVGHRKRKVWTGSWEWHCHLTASRTWRQVRSDVIRTQGEINTPHCGWPQPQPAVGRTAGKHCWMVPSSGPSDGLLRGHSDGCKSDSSEHGLGIRRILGWKGMLWEQPSSSKWPRWTQDEFSKLGEKKEVLCPPLMADTGLCEMGFSILFPILLLCFQTEVPACSTLLQPKIKGMF